MRFQQRHTQTQDSICNMKALFKYTLLIIVLAFWMYVGAVFAQPDKRECDVRVVPQFCNVMQGPGLAPLLSTGFKVVGVADFNNDHYPDLFLYNETTGDSYIWYLRPEQLQ